MHRALLRFGVFALALLTLAGCAALRQAGGPDPLPLTDTQRSALLAASDDLVADQAMQNAANDEAKRLALRDAYIANRLVLMDVAFLQYLRSLTSNKHTLDSATEGTVLGLSVLGTIRDSAQAKENLAALVAMIVGLKSNVDKNFFDNRGLDAIASMMVAKRKEVLLRIVTAMPSSTSAYSLVSARSDLNDYYLAGTLGGAFLTIQAEASKRDDKASKELEQGRLVANTMENLSDSTLDAKLALTKALGSKTLTLEALTKALTSLSVPPDKIPDTLEGAAKLLQSFVRSAVTTPKINALTSIFKDAGLLPDK